MVAATGVMIVRFGLMPTIRLPFTLGAFGVDLFLVPSGFIIAYSAARGTPHFPTNRLIRVIPACTSWAATLLTGWRGDGDRGGRRSLRWRCC